MDAPLNVVPLLCAPSEPTRSSHRDRSEIALSCPTSRAPAQHPHSRLAKLSDAHVLALRLYTTAVFKSLNDPLRDVSRTEPHPFPLTINFLTEGIRRLRAVGAVASEADEGSPLARVDLWRGMRNLQLDDRFRERGGTELAPMSSTQDMQVAIRYSASKDSLLLRLRTLSFMDRGADLSYLSAFPAEKEVLYPPLTYLRPSGRTQRIELDGIVFTVVDVVPSFGS